MFQFLKSLFNGNRPSDAVSNSSTLEVEELEHHGTENAVAAQVASPPPQPAAPKSERSLKLPLKTIVSRLTPPLAARLDRPPHDSDLLSLPMQPVVDQLARGAVRISFHDLKRNSPPGLFGGGTDLDATLVELPLNAILAQVNPAQLLRKGEQKRVLPPQSIGAVFAAKQPGGAISEECPKVPLAEGQDELLATHLMAHTGSVVKPEPGQKNPEAKTLTATPAPIPIKAAALPAPPPPVTKEKPAAEVRSPNPGNHTVAAPVKVTLASLARHWPDDARKEILSAHLAASVNIPFEELEGVLARGKAAFCWKQIRPWLCPAANSALSQYDEVLLELPLSILIPAFLARRPGQSQKKKLAPAGDLPDIFISRKQGPGETSNATPAAEPKSVPVIQVRQERINSPSAAAPSPKPAETRPAAIAEKSIGDSHSQNRTGATPADVVERACRLSGVSGALVGTSDGLLIASQLPAALVAETAAAFLPQILNRLGQYTKELKLEEPTQVEMLLGATPLQIFKTSELCFAVLGRPKEVLPKVQLSALACQLQASGK